MIAACPATPVHSTPLPRAPASLVAVPWVAASRGIAGVLFTTTGAAMLELPVGGRWADGSTAKVLWWPRRQGGAASFTIRGRSLGRGGSFLQALGRAGTGGGYPSIVELPSAGCWRLDVRTGSLRGTVFVRAVSP